MQQRRIGDRHVSAIGLGGMPMSIEGRPDQARAIRTIHAALDAGITLIDTADSYHRDPTDVGHNEILIAKALRLAGKGPDDVLVATKGGHRRPGDGSWYTQGGADYLKKACEASLQRLDVEAIGLYQFHRPDPATPYEESIGAVRDLLDEGKILLAGISNANPDQIRLAQQILGGRLVSVQNEHSPAFRTSEPEVELCTELDVAFLAYKPLGGIGAAGELGDRHGTFAAVADDRGVSPQQIALAWALAKAPVVIPIPGASRPESILDSVAAADLTLTADELTALG